MMVCRTKSEPTHTFSESTVKAEPYDVEVYAPATAALQPETPPIHPSKIPKVQPDTPRPRRLASQKASSINAELYGEDGLLDSQTTDSQAVAHLLKAPKLPGCQHVLMATADFMGIPLATDSVSPTPGPVEHNVEPGDRVQLPTPEPEETQVTDPVESQYPTWLAQQYYDQGRVSWDWALANAREPYFLLEGNPRGSEYRRSTTPSHGEDIISDLNATPGFIIRGDTPPPPVIRHPTPAPASPRQPPATEPSCRRTLILTAEERGFVRLLRRADERHF